ncbi:hypothetical protein XAXN_14905 [Xanthomonas axonopodis]|uniref:Uncharacterized protein n=1 Tax=Xanthomonas axonopodis TaxID=53413 RepID=A0A0P6VDY5_9XANT|nr:hypothetical protein XAXN_14905 [Xanthomonas axonopodis]
MDIPISGCETLSRPQDDAEASALTVPTALVSYAAAPSLLPSGEVARGADEGAVSLDGADCGTSLGSG